MTPSTCESCGRALTVTVDDEGRTRVVHEEPFCEAHASAALVAFLERARSRGLLPRAELKRLLAWANEIKRRMVAGELTDDEAKRQLGSLLVDLARRGAVKGWGARFGAATLDDLFPPKRGGR